MRVVDPRKKILAREQEEIFSQAALCLNRADYTLTLHGSDSTVVGLPQTISYVALVVLSDVREPTDLRRNLDEIYFDDPDKGGALRLHWVASHFLNSLLGSIGSVCDDRGRSVCPYPKAS